MVNPVIKHEAHFKLFMVTLLVLSVIVKNCQYFKLNLTVGVKPMKTPLFAGYLALMVNLSILMVFFIFIMLQKDVIKKILNCQKCVVISV